MDIFHQNEDWIRLGPGRVAASAFVLIVVSGAAWKDAWAGAGDPGKNKGVRAEANAVKSIEQLGGGVFQDRCRLTLLPGSNDDDIPFGMHGVMRQYLKGFEFADLELLLRDLTKQPMYVKPPLGEVPILPPAMTTHTPEIVELESPAATPAEPKPTAEPDSEDQQERIEQLKSQLLHSPSRCPAKVRIFRGSGSGSRLRAGCSPSSDPRPRRAAPTSAYLSSRVGSSDQRRNCVGRPVASNITYGATAMALHLIPVPQIPLSQQALSLLDDTVTRLIRDLDLVDSSAGLTHAFTGDDIVVEADTVRLGYNNEVSRGEFLGLRAGRTGQVSLWYSLPRDRMGSVLDEHRLKHARMIGVHARRQKAPPSGVAPLDSPMFISRAD